jgi:hypothetical protein
MTRLLTAIALLIFWPGVALYCPGQHSIFFSQNVHTTGGGGCTSLPFSDSGTHANGALSSSWNNPSTAPIQILSNAFTVPAYTVGNNVAFANCSGFTSSHYAKGTFSVIDGFEHFGAAVHVIDGNNYYYIDCTTGGCNLETYIAGSATYVTTFSLVPVTGNTVCLELDSGTSVKLKLNGSYDAANPSVSGLSGTGAGGVFFGNQSTTPATMINFQTGNGTCP